MVPAAIIIMVVAVGALLLWIEDRREIRRIKRDVQGLVDRIDRVEEWRNEEIIRRG